jgi:uncharacterized protein
LKKFYLILFIILPVLVSAQDSTGSLAFKKNFPVRRSTIFYQPDLSYRIIQQFNLIKEANSGDPLAQHELGLRYLQGEGQQADTSLAAYWIRKAALQKLPAAAYNYGILLYNGWGTEWNPFEAYNNFLIAANDSMPQALYIIGILNTDNLIVKRDWRKAYHYIKFAADKGHTQAVNILDAVEKKVSSNYDPDDSASTLQNEAPPSSSGLVFIDFDRPAVDPTEVVSDTLLFEDLLLSGNKKFEEIIRLENDKPVISFNESHLALLQEAADWGCPEAITLLGRFHEKGMYYKRNPITAAAFYIKASRMDSYRAAFLLYQLIKDQAFINNLKAAALTDDPAAMFVWYGLFNFNLENSLTEKDAVDLLVKSAEKNYLPAVVEAGLNLYTGNHTRRDVPAAIAVWREASLKGIKEAEIRIAASVVFGETNGNMESALNTLQTGMENGSLLAQAAAAYTLSNAGDNNKAEVVRLYRTAAQRGSRYAASQLERIYNDIRPVDNNFKLE